MKKKVLYGLIIASACCFVYLFVLQVMKVSQIFKSPEGFTLTPILFAVIILVLLLCHVGLYVVLMDKKDMRHVVDDVEEWWTKWDRV